VSLLAAAGYLTVVISHRLSPQVSHPLTFRMPQWHSWVVWTQMLDGESEETSSTILRGAERILVDQSLFRRQRAT
jgi:hypothetical protein